MYSMPNTNEMHGQTTAQAMYSTSWMSNFKVGEVRWLERVGYAVNVLAAPALGPVLLSVAGESSVAWLMSIST